MKWKPYKESQRKSANLENIIKSLSLPIKRDVFKKVINKNSKTVYEILAYTTSDTTYEAKVCQAFLTELKELNRLKRFCTFHQRLNSVFHDQLDDENFLAWLVAKLNLIKGRFKDSVHAWRSNHLKETRGRHGFSLEDKQVVYNAWLDNCIVSTDGRNGRNMIRVSKRK